MALTLAFTILRPPPTSGPYARDFEAYYAAGAVWDAGGNPWSREVWPVERTIAGVDDTRDELLPYVGPAAALPLLGALARLPHPIAVRLWSGLLAGAFCALFIASLVLARTRRVDALLAGLMLAIASGPSVSALALGQIALLSAGAIACALVAYDRKAVAAGAFTTFLAGLQPNLAIALIARMRDRVAITSAALGAVAFAALTLAAGGGVSGFLTYLHRLGEHGRAERFDVIQHTPAAIAWAFGAPAEAAAAITTIVALAATGAAIVAGIRARLDARDGTLLALAALPLAVPFFHEHDFVVELIPVIVLAVCAQGAARGWAGVGAVLALVDWLNAAQRPPAAGQIVALALAVACAFVALGRGRYAARADLVPLAVALLFVGFAVPLALAHPAPTWPDALPPAYHAPTNADASAVWAQEQQLSGLEQRAPVWGFLRALPLAGCVALGVSVTLAGRRSP